MARTYKRDSNGRFAGGGGGSSGGGSKRPAAKPVSRGVNRLTRDNAGKITSVGGEGATARGGRLKTAAGNKRATVTAKVSGGAPAGTMKGKVKRDTGAMSKVGRQPAKPAAAAARTATPKAAKPAAAPKPAARRKPLTGVNDAVKGNLKGFKGLPVSLRSRSQAAAAQRQRNRKTIKSTEVIGARRGVTQTAGGGQKIRISKGKSEQMNLLTGRADTVTNLKVKAVPTNKGSAPGSKSRRRSFGTMTRKMETPASALGRRRLRVGGIEAARKKATPYNTKKAAKTKATRGKALKFYESQKQGRR